MHVNKVLVFWIFLKSETKSMEMSCFDHFIDKVNDEFS